MFGSISNNLYNLMSAPRVIGGGDRLPSGRTWFWTYNERLGGAGRERESGNYLRGDGVAELERVACTIVPLGTRTTGLLRRLSEQPLR